MIELNRIVIESAIGMGIKMSIKWLTPAVTALDENHNIDLQANSRIYNHLIDNGMDGILLMGSIGEFYAMSMDEKKKLISNAVKTVKHRVQLLVGTSCMVTQECIELSNYALKEGADAVIVIPPYYFSLEDKEVESFYSTLAENINGNIYLYNFPARTGYDLKPEIILKLAIKYKNIVGIKDTVDKMGHTRDIIQTVKSKIPYFEVYSGFDEFFTHNILSGGDGYISGISNFIPEIATALRDAVRNNDIEKTYEYQRKMDSLMDIYAIRQQFVPIIKKAMVIRGIQMTANCKNPMRSASEEEAEQIIQIINKVL
jgi:4-hydroxy-tetrahydrodipicolinate synthase